MDTKFIGKNTWSEHPEYDRGFRNGQQIKQAEIDAIKAKIDDAFLENAKLKHVIDQVKLHNGSLGFRSMQRMIEELLK